MRVIKAAAKSGKIIANDLEVTDVVTQNKLERDSSGIILIDEFPQYISVPIAEIIELKSIIADLASICNSMSTTSIPRDQSIAVGDPSIPSQLSSIEARAKAVKLT